MASIPHITILGSLNMDLVAYVPHRESFPFTLLSSITDLNPLPHALMPHTHPRPPP